MKIIFDEAEKQALREKWIKQACDAITFEIEHMPIHPDMDEKFEIRCRIQVDKTWDKMPVTLVDRPVKLKVNRQPQVNHNYDKRYGRS